MITVRRFFSIDSAKAVKAQAYGYLNAINYMAPASTAGVGNLCPHASPGCLALCLGWHSGQAGMVKKGQEDTAINSVRASRVNKAQLFMRDRANFLDFMVRAIRHAKARAGKMSMNLCVRLNGATDIAWEGIRIGQSNAFDMFPEVQFVDYTKNPRRMLAWCEGKLPANYHLTFSQSETNEGDCVKVLAAGGTVATVFAREFPTEWLGFPVIDGDKHDLRHLDPRGCVIALTPKGLRAKRDQSGFVVR